MSTRPAAIPAKLSGHQRIYSATSARHESTSGCMKGGEMVFYKNSRTIGTVKPRYGSALVFFHDKHPLSPLHEGSVIREGKKYAMRTDILFE